MKAADYKSIVGVISKEGFAGGYGNDKDCKVCFLVTRVTPYPLNPLETSCELKTSFLWTLTGACLIKGYACAHGKYTNTNTDMAINTKACV